MQIGKAVSSIAFSPDGKLLAAGEKGQAPSILIFDIESQKCISTLANAHRHGVTALAFDHTGTKLVSAGFK
jgi:WD40 repeat protein